MGRRVSCGEIFPLLFLGWNKKVKILKLLIHSIHHVKYIVVLASWKYFKQKLILNRQMNSIKLLDVEIFLFLAEKEHRLSWIS